MPQIWNFPKSDFNNNEKELLIEPIQKSNSSLQRKAELKILGQTREADCNFWIVLARSGKLELRELDINEPLDNPIHSLAQIGFQENEPVLIADTQSDRNKYLYIMPDRLLPQACDTRSWSLFLADKMASIGSHSFGLYLDPQLVSYELSYLICFEFIKALILAANDQKFHLLQGQHNYNTLVNLALSLRSDLKVFDIDLVVFH